MMKCASPILRFRAALLIAVAGALAGCGSTTRLPVPPNVLADGSGGAQLRALPPAQQRPDMEILYVTDRTQDRKSHPGMLWYSYGRVPDLAYGVATVSMGKSARWEDVAEYSGRPIKSEDYRLDITKVHERGRVSAALDRLKPVDGRLVMTEFAGAQAEQQQVQAVLEEALARTSYKDVYIFVHGCSNYFDEPVLRIAGLWHYLGRRGVPVAYAWASGYGGWFGYFHDRESAEFTIPHFKQTLRMIAGCPEVERVHIMGHSRGAEVACAALRELNGEYRAAGKDPQVELKLATLVLASPDIDWGVFAQRFGSENLASVARQVVVYSSKEDGMLSLSQWFYSSGGRVGTFDPTNSWPQLWSTIDQVPTLQFVQCNVSGYASTHAYMFADPAAMSDLVLVLRDGKMAGAEHGRPLRHENGWWYLDENYFGKR